MSEIETLREFRDEVLLGSSKGQDYVAWYYQYSPEMVAALVERPTLALDIADAKTTLWPFVESLAVGDGSVPLSSGMVDAVHALADRSKLLVSDEFRERIETELQTLDLASRIGQTGAQVKAGIEALPGRTIARIGFE